ncbi:uncharacterized protein METZ01_LOCUS492937, partial [marine metagenome]
HRHGNGRSPVGDSSRCAVQYPKISLPPQNETRIM